MAAFSGMSVTSLAAYLITKSPIFETLTCAWLVLMFLTGLYHIMDIIYYGMIWQLQITMNLYQTMFAQYKSSPLWDSASQKEVNEGIAWICDNILNNSKLQTGLDFVFKHREIASKVASVVTCALALIPAVLWAMCVWNMLLFILGPISQILFKLPV